MENRHIVLVGAGHGHLGVIRDCRRWPKAVSVTVVAPGDFWYSGLATGVLGGQFEPAQDRVDVAALCRRAGAKFIDGRLTGLDADARQITIKTTAGPQVVAYDVLSLNLGSEPVALPGGDVDARRVFAVKPLEMLADLRRRVEAERGLDIAVIGGGYSGSECALNLARLPGNHRVTLLTRNSRPADNLPGRAPERVGEALRDAGIVVRCDTDVTRIDAEAVHVSDGERLPADVILLATGLQPPMLAGDLGLNTDEVGRIVVDDHLRCLGHDNIVAVGDAARLVGRDPLPTIGVVAIRQGERLRDNLPAAALGKPLKPFRPSRRHLLILNLGDGRGLATWGSLHFTGRSAMWLKRRIDLRWMEQFAQLGSSSVSDT